MQTESQLLRQNLNIASRGARLSAAALQQLRVYTRDFHFSIISGDLIYLDHGWYVTHTGLLRLARRNRCTGIHVHPVPEFSDPRHLHWAFKAVVYKSSTCKGFVGYGDADPSNVSALVRGAEMRVAETRAVNRALRKAYGIGICSVEEIASVSGRTDPPAERKKLPSTTAAGTGSNGQPRLRDRLCQLIRKHELDPVLVKSYAVDFCGTKTLKDASRDQVENFVNHLADWATKDKNALVRQLNSYVRAEGAA